MTEKDSSPHAPSRECFGQRFAAIEAALPEMLTQPDDETLFDLLTCIREQQGALLALVQHYDRLFPRRIVAIEDRIPEQEQIATARATLSKWRLS